MSVTLYLKHPDDCKNDPPDPNNSPKTHSTTHLNNESLPTKHISKNKTDPVFTWAFFNFPSTLQIAGLLLLTGGIITLISGAAIASTPVLITGAVFTGIGGLITIGAFSLFHSSIKDQKDDELPSPLLGPETML